MRLAVLLRAEVFLLLAPAALECVSCIIALKSVTVVGMYELFNDFKLKSLDRGLVFDLLDFVRESTLLYVF